MCHAIHFVSRDCGHHWYYIALPCRLETGFNHCHHFRDGVARDAADKVVARHLCPACAYPHTYDANQIRMVVSVKKRWRWGVGPSREDMGIECCVM
jgi:hypothetical protein